MLKYLLTDDESLTCYLSGQFVEFNDIKRRMFLSARSKDSSLPDHYYHLAKEISFNGINSLSDCITHGVTNLASSHLEIFEKTVYVKSNMQNKWQEIMTYIPPLIMQSAVLAKNEYPSNTDIIKYYMDYVFHNTKHTSIPSTKIKQLDHYVNEKKGLHDLHMHLNGALETDLVWQDYLYDPTSIYHDLINAFKNEKVREQFEQESSLLNPLKFLTLLKTAQKLRLFFYDYLFPSKPILGLEQNKHKILYELTKQNSIYSGSYLHPFLSLINVEYNYPHMMSVEGLMYTLLFKEISISKNETLSSFFHFYLLILGLTNRLLVQQVHQNGFEQFQKHTLNGLRESSEKIFLRRYFQLHGNHSRNIRFLEGRFSPKATNKKLVEFIDSIFNGWEKMKKTILEIDNYEKTPFSQPELKLIAHFIKQKDKNPDPYVRHKSLRSDIWQKAKVLSLLLKNHDGYKRKIVGVDAAASEFDAPPEVFSSTFRLMRNSGIKHFTFHAGEDFYHIISGLRVIYEAIIFCGLQNGDRIGHATAAGISAELWLSIVGNEILIKQGEYLDNLIFAYHLIIKLKIDQMQKLIPLITQQIDNLSNNVYDKSYPITILEEAWMIRQCCPIHLLSEDKNDARLSRIYSEYEWNFQFQISKTEKENNKVVELFSAYHSLNYRKKYDQIISVDPKNIFGLNEIEKLQLALLQFMNTKEIVIETLPTSNVRIGFHKDFRTYHLWNWIKWRKEGNSIPPIVVGSDDTGIFATNIYNEYANIYCFLLNDKKLPHYEIMEIIKRLDDDSHLYRFE